METRCLQHWRAGSCPCFGGGQGQSSPHISVLPAGYRTVSGNWDPRGWAELALCLPILFTWALNPHSKEAHTLPMCFIYSKLWGLLPDFVLCASPKRGGLGCESPCSLLSERGSST